jgi:nitroreductase
LGLLSSSIAQLTTEGVSAMGKNKIDRGTAFLSLLLMVLPIMVVVSESFAQAPDMFAVIHSRKSVRHFTGQEVSKELLEKILRAGMAAPTAVNKQPWSFVVITDRKTLDNLKDGLPSAKMLDKAGAAIIVCAIPEKAHGQKLEYSVIDSACAGENILLAAEALGLGAVWTAAYPDNDKMAFVRNTLNIPDNVIPLNVIPIGYPTGVDKPKDKFKPENIHWEKW